MDNKMSKTWTVYVHVCKINQKAYVGITCKKPEYRWGYEGRGYKKQLFYKAIEKYGWDNFEHIILHDSLTEKEAKELEIYYIDKLQTNKNKNGYNVSLGGDGYLGVDNSGEKNPMYGRHHTEETKRIISEKNKFKPNPMLGKKHTEEAKRKMSITRKKNARHVNLLTAEQRRFVVKRAIEANSKSVCQFSVEMELIKIYPSAIQAERETSILHNGIGKCCNGKAKTAGGYIWIYEKNLKNLFELKYELISNLVNKNVLELGMPVYQFDMDLNFINKYNSLHEAERLTNIDRTHISDACKGIYKSSGGYIWKFVSDVPDIDVFKKEYCVNWNKAGKFIEQYDKEGNFINSYVSCAEAARALNIPRTSISKATLGMQKTAGGYIWKEKNIDVDSAS